MKEIKLEVLPREEIGKTKLKSLRSGGFIPAVVYGEGKKSRSVKVDRKIFSHLLREHRGENIIIDLAIAGEAKKDKDINVMIKELQHDPVNEEILHIDFQQISLTKEIQVKIPIIAKGEPIGVKQDGGALDHLLWELEIECLPTQIPQGIEVDVTNLQINDTVHIKDLNIPKGIKVLHDPDLIVLSVAPPVKEEVVEAVPGEAAPLEPEVIKEKKEVPEEGKEEKPEEKKEKKEEKKEEKK